MSTEVECKVNVNSSLTAICSTGGEKNQNKPEEAHLQNKPDITQEEGQKKTEEHLDGQTTEVGKIPTDLHKKCKVNDKENDQNAQSSNNVDSGEIVKEKVMEAPPPKVNPWTKRTTGRVSNNTIHSSSPDKGKVF